MKIGFSTGSIALGDFRKGVYFLKQKKIRIIELSSLREAELNDLVSSLDELGLDYFSYISFHAPSRLRSFTEKELLLILEKVKERGWPIIVHPDIICDFSLWRGLGNSVCIENMDKRKDIGRTTSDLEILFSKLPEASFCLDIAHARQVDPTMTEAILMIRRFGHRLKQLHVSDVNSQSKHEPLNLEALIAYKRLAPYIPDNIPIILESPVSFEKLESEIKIASYIFDNDTLLNIINSFENKPSGSMLM